MNLVYSLCLHQKDGDYYSLPFSVPSCFSVYIDIGTGPDSPLPSSLACLLLITLFTKKNIHGLEVFEKYFFSSFSLKNLAVKLPN